jgi:hypothetical protein
MLQHAQNVHCVRIVCLCVVYDNHSDAINLLVFVVYKSLFSVRENWIFMSFDEYKFRFYVTKIGIDIATNNKHLI